MPSSSARDSRGEGGEIPSPLPCSACESCRRSRRLLCAGACHTDCRYVSCVSPCCSASRGTASTSASVRQRTVVSCSSPSTASYPNWSPACSWPSSASSPVEERKQLCRSPDLTMKKCETGCPCRKSTSPREKRMSCIGADCISSMARLRRDRCRAATRSAMRFGMAAAAEPRLPSVRWRNMLLSIISTSTLVLQSTVELRLPRPSSNPVSPKKSPGPNDAISRGGVFGRVVACTEHSPLTTM
mmetsp:Transcript_11077/g.35269  ORF Transcript_11077/g.35269 Transcript_11077/m.35269 type:complete len:243 (+) Transcript_11077:1074-1802(+)